MTNQDPLKAMCDQVRNMTLDQVLNLIDSQTHTSELGDPYRHIRALVEALKVGES